MSAIADLSMPAVADAASRPPGWSDRLGALDRGKRLRLLIGAVLLVALAVGAVVLGRQPDWRVLYASLGDKDGGAVVAQLAQMNVPYKYTEGGGAILVPSDKVHDLRLKLASLGLPKGSVGGFEVSENNRFGMTQFQERLSFQRGLEGELTRSIQGLASVQSARVHLALPSQNGFFREQQKPSASVLLTLHPGRALERSQIAGIVHLVASSVPELKPAAVSVLDDSGKMLSDTAETQAGTADAQQLQYQQQIEQQYARRILDILEPVVGRQNVKAQVSADLDFSQTEATVEEHRPNLSAQASAVRSQQTVETTSAQQPAVPSGVPGATSNQPPGASSAPMNGKAAPLAPTAAPKAAPAAGPGRRESTINYEVDKTVKTVRSATGQVRRLNAAVVINASGATPLTAEQIEQMTALVRETIGFSKERGDSVSLMNTPFLVQGGSPQSEPPLWRDPQTLELARGFAWPIGLVLLGAIVLLGLVRPGLKALAVRPTPVVPLGARLDAIEAEAPSRPALGLPQPSTAVENGGITSAALPAPDEAQTEQARLEGARHMARENPVAVANIVKAWVHGDMPAAA